MAGFIVFGQQLWMVLAGIIVGGLIAAAAQILVINVIDTYHRQMLAEIGAA